MSSPTKRSAKQLKLRLAQDQLEIEKTLALRYDIFNLELQKGLPQSRSTCKDRDEFDLDCDHLIVVDESRDEAIVGTYRILRREVARQSKGFYSQNEFELDGIYDIPQEIAEVGRSCVHLEYRDGSVINFLWAGLARYMKEYQLRYLFGCASLHTTDPKLASHISSYIKQKGYAAKPGFEAYPRKGFELSGFDPNYEIKEEKTAKKLLPILIKGYLRLGSHIFPVPAYDPVFKTIDFFVIFDRQEIEKRYGLHYRFF